MIQTRTITQVLVWKLILNPMTSNTESSELVAWSDDKDKLLEWYNNHIVTPYTENGHSTFECHGTSHDWYKTFEKGSILEWYNPMSPDGTVNHYGQGLQCEWVNEDILPNIPWTKI